MSDSVIVEIEQGKLKGKTGLDFKNGKYYSFQGIPYAKPPLGNLRFKAPVPPEKWQGIRDATSEASGSLSKHFIIRDKIVGSEDCLYLNVYTPQNPNNISSLKPVMFWIHPSGFTTWSSESQSFGSEFIMTEDVVLVTFNYRLGILGFLSMDNPECGIPGNAGMKDMVQALKWVQQNIIKFGGDPNNVTVFGSSSGAAAAHLLMLSPMATGLFHRVILQSGCALNPWVFGLKNTKKIAEVLGFKSDNDKDIATFLQSAPAMDFITAQDKIKYSFSCDTVRPFGVVIENSSNEPAFFSEHPLNIIASGNYNKVPMIIGYTDQEGIITELSRIKLFGPTQEIKDLETKIPYHYNITKGTDLSKKIAKCIEEFYFQRSSTNKTYIDKFQDLETDTLFFRAIYIAVRNHVKNLNCPIYFYRFAADNQLNLFKKLLNINRPGACHVDDVGYLFKNEYLPEIAPNSEEELCVNRMVRLWTNFAKRANPNPVKPDPLLPVTWRAVEPDNIHYLNFDTQLTTGTFPEAKRMKFWDELDSHCAINSML